MIGCFCILLFHQPYLPREELLHHPLLDGVRFVATLLQRGNLGIYVREDGGDGTLFTIVIWDKEAKLPNLFRIRRGKCTALFKSLPTFSA